MLRVGRRSDNRRMSAKSHQKWVRYAGVGAGQAHKHQRAVFGADASQHILSEEAGLSKAEPAGTLQVVGKLGPAGFRVVEGDVSAQCSAVSK